MVRTRLSSLLQLLFACSCCGTSSSSAGPRPPWGGPVAGVWPWAVDQQLLTQGSVSLRVAAIQLTDFADGVDRTAAEETAARVAKAVGLLAQAAALGVDVALFPEMSLVQYNGAALLEGTQDSMDAAEAAMAAACRQHKIWAIVGLPHYFTPNATSALPSCCTPQKCWYNTGLVIDDAGNKTYRQAKMHSAGPDGAEGKWLDTFKVAKNVTASMQICFDAYFPHMSLIPVLGGSRLIFDLSSERGYGSDQYYETVGTLYQGRAQEAAVHLVQANTGAAIQRTPGKVHVGTYAGSHGNSQIISPDGHILARATHVGEQIAYADIEVVTHSSIESGMVDSNPLFKGWLQEGLKLLNNRMPISLEADDKTP